MGSELLIWAREENTRFLETAPKDGAFESRRAYLEAKIAWGAEGRLREPVEQEVLDIVINEAAPLRLPECVIRLYAWADGEAFGGFIKPSYFYLPIKQALDMHRNYVRMAKVERTVPPEFANFWPIMSNSNSVDFGVLLTDDRVGNFPVYGVRVWEGDYLLVSHAVEPYLFSMLECKRFGVYGRGKMHAKDPSEYLKGEVDVFKRNCGVDVFPFLDREGITRLKFPYGDFVEV